MIRSDLSSIGSVEQVTVMDSTFAAISAIPSPALVKHQKYLDTAGSVPHLDRFTFMESMQNAADPRLWQILILIEQMLSENCMSKNI